jgi:branched-chain amino acid transport system ATP-binding protein
LLKLSDVSVHYGRIPAVQKLSLDVAEGELVGLVGHNGAGKTTTLMTITGVLKPTAGEVVFQGSSLVGRSPDEILRSGISLVPEGRRIFGRLTVGENLKIGTTSRRDGDVDKDVEDVLERFPVLRHHWDKSGSKLSGGEQQQLAIARALLSRPKLLLLDEPTLGLAPLVFKEIFRIVETLRKAGQTILMVEQNAAKALEISDYAYVLELGKNRYEGSGEAIRTDDRVRRLYLGR